MPIFRKTDKKIIDTNAVKKSKDEDLRKQLNQILQAKRQLTIQMEHWERIKRITKDPKEVQNIESKLSKMRMDFLNFSTDKF
ncbi:AC29-like protein [Mythimna sequax nucleopolyhedrovirus]|nr:AC29-like protein [Mythimna sequax nucleopolyhedrovirus]